MIGGHLPLQRGPSFTPGPRSSVLLSVDWTTATGNTESAVRDGTKAAAITGGNRNCVSSWASVLSVVDGSGVGAPSGNALRIRSVAGCGHVAFENVFPAPTASEQFWRVRYYAMNGTGQTDTKQHPHCHWPVGNIEIVHMGIDNQGGSTWSPRFIANGGQFDTDFPFGIVPKPNNVRLVIQPDVWVRYEYVLHWLNATQCRVYPSIYNAAGTLLAGPSDWRHTDTSQTVTDWYRASAANVIERHPSGDTDNIRTVSFGMGQDGSAGGYYYVAAAAFGLGTSTSDYIGAV